MKIDCTIRLEYKNPKTAQTIHQALCVDDLQFVTSKVTGKKIQAVIQSSSVSSLLHTIDDYLSCVSVAESVSE